LSAHSLTNASYSGSRSRFILIDISFRHRSDCGHGSLRFQSMPHRKALAVRMKPGLSQAPCLTFISGLTRKDRRSVRTSRCWTCKGREFAFVAYCPPHSTASSQVFHRVEKEAAWTKISTASGEFNPCPKGLTHRSPFCRKVVFHARPMPPR
jgi:hypothetical protein